MRRTASRLLMLVLLVLEYGTAISGIIENDARTSRIPPFGLPEEDTSKKILS